MPMAQSSKRRRRGLYTARGKRITKLSIARKGLPATAKTASGKTVTREAILKSPVARQTFSTEVIERIEYFNTRHFYGHANQLERMAVSHPAYANRYASLMGEAADHRGAGGQYIQAARFAFPPDWFDDPDNEIDDEWFYY